MNQLQVVSRGKYDDRGYSNEETIARLMLAKPEKISSVLTYTYGMDDDRFPLTFLTEGQGSVGVKDIDGDEWTWDVMGRMKFHDYIVHAPSSGQPGKGGAFVDIEFATHTIIEQYGLLAPDGRTQVRVMRDLGPGTHGGYLYRVKLTNPDPNAYINLNLLTVGKHWCLTAPTVSRSYSKGNRSNVMGPGSMKNQLEFHRYSKEIGGNLANTVVSYAFKSKSGGTTNLWINEEMRQFDIQMRVMDEERLWVAEYNRNEDGTISLLDLDNNEPIPHTAGMAQVCRESNYDTYGEYLTLNKVKRTIGDILDKSTDTGSMEVVLFCGKGFYEDFDLAIRHDANDNGFATPLGDKMIGEAKGGLSYGNYFRQYKTIDNHIITLKHLSICDKGSMADVDRANGNIHPRTGLPMSSHQAYMIDFSTYDGERNIRKVRQKGQIYHSGVIKGMAPVPASWGGVPTNSLATDVDVSKYEIKNSFGLHIANATKMLHLKCVL